MLRNQLSFLLANSINVAVPLLIEIDFFEISKLLHISKKTLATYSELHFLKLTFSRGSLNKFGDRLYVMTWLVMGRDSKWVRATDRALNGFGLL